MCGAHIFCILKGGASGYFVCFPYLILFKKNKNKINSSISVLFSWKITLNLFFFYLDIDSLLWTKHSSITGLQEASSVEENEPVEGMFMIVIYLIDEISSSCLFLLSTTLANDCYSDREAAQEEVDHGAKGMYVPECTPDNKYQRVQCHKSAGRNAVVVFFSDLISSSCHIRSCLIASSTFYFYLFCFCPWLGIISIGYCWCANDETGKPIPGTSVQNSKPTNCDNLPAHVLNRPTPPPAPKENLKPVYRPLTAEEGNNRFEFLENTNTTSTTSNGRFLNWTSFSHAACTGKRKSRLQSDMVEFFKENLAAFLVNKTANNPNR
jgi:hypothetical protein